MEARQLRAIEDGAEYDKLFPQPLHKDNSIKADASVEDTVKLIKKTVPQTKWHTSKLAAHLKGKTLEETCSNIWHFVYGHIQYKKDKAGVEQVRSPRRTWQERKTGVDCDCYSEFISSILFNLGIPHKLRIAMYDYGRSWQHIYPIVPTDGRLDHPLEDHDKYIVIDCVKDQFDAEQPYLEHKDYNMELQFLDGTAEDSDDEATNSGCIPPAPASIDARDLLEYSDEELGNLFSDIGKGLSNAFNNVKKSVNTNISNFKSSVNTNVANAKKGINEGVKKVGEVVKEGVHIINRYVNPLTVVLRNGILLSMKMNLMNASGKLKYGYLSDDLAQKMGIDLGKLAKLRDIKNNFEQGYYDQGGEISVLKQAILEGKGNKGNVVPMSGFEGLGEVYADIEEYRIMNTPVNGLGDLGEPVTIAASLTAASATIAGLIAAIKAIGNIFNGKPANDFNSDDPDQKQAAANPAASANKPSSLLPSWANNLSLTPGGIMAAGNALKSVPGGSNFNIAPGSGNNLTLTPNTDSGGNDESSNVANTSQGDGYSDSSGGGSDANAGSSDNTGNNTLPAVHRQKSAGPVSTAIQQVPKAGEVGLPNDPQQKGMMEWIKTNPIPAAAIGAGIVVAGYMLYEHSHSQSASKGKQSLSGLPEKRHKRKKKAEKAKNRKKFFCEKLSR